MDTNLCFGQRYDEQLGILEPWYVNDCVDRIKQLKINDKIALEWGGGASTVWWGRMAKEVYSVDHNQEWYLNTKEQIDTYALSDKVTVRYVPTHEGDTAVTRDNYVNPFPDVKPDICIVDGVHRYECAEYAVNVLKPEILIIDNHQQDYVFMCPKLDELLEGVRMERFIQHNHTDHSGNAWATAIFYLNEKQ